VFTAAPEKLFQAEEAVRGRRLIHKKITDSSGRGILPGTLQKTKGGSL